MSVHWRGDAGEIACVRVVRGGNLPRWERVHMRLVAVSGAAALVIAAMSAGAQADVTYAWGQNPHGELGIGSGSSYSPVPVPTSVLNSGVTALAGGNNFNVAIQNGAVYAWGNNNFGQLGNGTTGGLSLSPGPVTVLTAGVTAVSCGANDTLALRAGTVFAWGYDNTGQLGNGSTVGTSTPTAVIGLTSGVTAIASGTAHNLAIKNGAVYAWGINDFGELGNGTTTDSHTAVAVSGLTSGVTAIAGGFEHSLALKNGTVYAWGINSVGQLGNGSTTSSKVPVAVSGITSATAIAAGGDHNLAVQNGLVYAWGYGGHGQLGDGAQTVSSTVPKLVPGPTNIVEVAASQYSCFALSNDGTLWAWGDNSSGQLGDASTFTRLSPVIVPAPDGYRWSSLGDCWGGSQTATVTSIAAVAVPKPASIGILAMGIGGLLMRRRQRGGTRAQGR